VRFEVLERRGLENDYVTVAVGLGYAAMLAMHFKWRDPWHKPLVDPWSGDDLDQRDAIITPAAAHAEIHRGVHQDLPVHGRQRPIERDRRVNLVRGTLAHVHFGPQ
jgi:hypothetical protein